MDTSTALEGYKVVYKQRNALLAVVAFLLFANLLLSAKVFFHRKELLVVPYLNKEFELGHYPSETYIAQMSEIHLNDLLNISPENVEQKKSRILKYTENSSWGNINNYFDDLIKTYTRFKVITSFAPKTIFIDTNNLEVLVKGTFVANWGLDGKKEEEKTFLLKYVFTHGILLVKEFKELEDLK